MDIKFTNAEEITRINTEVTNLTNFEDAQNKMVRQWGRFFLSHFS